MKKSTEKARILTEALPYIQKFHNKTFVIKFGGSIMRNMEAKKAFIEDVVLLNLVGIKIIIVHGGGPEITERIEKIGIKTEFIDGLRKTDSEVIEVAEMVLAGRINKEIAHLVNSMGGKAVGLSGKDGNLIKATKKKIYKEEKEIDLGYVGDVEKIDKKILEDLIDLGYIPIISPIGFGADGETYNINADFVASAVSGELKAEKLVLMTDVEGLYRDFENKRGFITAMTSAEAKELIETKAIAGGMLPKLTCAAAAVERGTKNVHILDGRVEHSLLIEVLTDKGIGTMIHGGEVK
ncbi:MAG: acetylglutamate kinase [Clostridiales bacterium]|nr:MAG: acetylglutamate kinase [Clostridiales bacterium]